MSTGIHQQNLLPVQIVQKSLDEIHLGPLSIELQGLAVALSQVIQVDLIALHILAPHLFRGF